MSIFVVVIFVIAFTLVGIAFALLYPIKYQDLIAKHSNEFDLPPELVASVINVESGYDTNVVSDAGARGLMQLMPTTAVEIANVLGVDNFHPNMLFDPDINIRFGCFYLSYLLDNFNNNLPTALAGYNAGPNNVKGWLLNKTYSVDGVSIKQTPYDETNGFIEKVNKNIKIYSKRFYNSGIKLAY